IAYPALRSAIPRAVPTRPAPIMATDNLFDPGLVAGKSVLLFLIPVISRSMRRLAYQAKSAECTMAATLTLRKSSRNSVGFRAELAYNDRGVAGLNQSLQRLKIRRNLLQESSHHSGALRIAVPRPLALSP